MSITSTPLHKQGSLVHSPDSKPATGSTAVAGPINASATTATPSSARALPPTAVRSGASASAHPPAAADSRSTRSLDARQASVPPGPAGSESVQKAWKEVPGLIELRSSDDLAYHEAKRVSTEIFRNTVPDNASVAAFLDAALHKGAPDRPIVGVSLPRQLEILEGLVDTLGGARMRWKPAAALAKWLEKQPDAEFKAAAFELLGRISGEVPALDSAALVRAVGARLKPTRGTVNADPTSTGLKWLSRQLAAPLTRSRNADYLAAFGEARHISLMNEAVERHPAILTRSRPSASAGDKPPLLLSQRGPGPQGPSASVHGATPYLIGPRGLKDEAPPSVGAPGVSRSATAPSANESRKTYEAMPEAARALLDNVSNHRDSNGNLAWQTYPDTLRQREDGSYTIKVLNTRNNVFSDFSFDDEGDFVFKTDLSLDAIRITANIPPGQDPSARQAQQYMQRAKE